MANFKSLCGGIALVDTATMALKVGKDYIVDFTYRETKDGFWFTTFIELKSHKDDVCIRGYIRWLEENDYHRLATLLEGTYKSAIFEHKSCYAGLYNFDTTEMMFLSTEKVPIEYLI